MLARPARRAVAAVRSAAAAKPGLRTGPIHADIDAAAAIVFTMMTTFEGDDHRAAVPAPAGSAAGVSIRHFETPMPLPLGIKRVIRTREEIRVRPPDAIEFRHLTGPVRGMAEVILVQPLGDSRCRVTYTGELPPSGTLLRMTHRLLARPAVERIVRAHLADLARRVEGEGGRKRQ